MTLDPTIPEAVGLRLRWAREQAGLSQGQVAKILDYHRPTVSQIEAGQRTVRPDEIARFAEMYDVREVWIVKGDAEAGETVDPRIELAARELGKLRKEDLDALLRAIRAMRSERGQRP